MRGYLIASLVLLAAGLFDCAHSSSRIRMSDAEFMQRVQEYNQEVEKHDQIHCEKVRPIGSNIPRWICTKKWSKTAETLETQDIMRRMQRTEGRPGN